MTQEVDTLEEKYLGPEHLRVPLEKKRLIVLALAFSFW